MEVELAAMVVMATARGSPYSSVRQHTDQQSHPTQSPETARRRETALADLPHQQLVQPRRKGHGSTASPAPRRHP